jgi:hypothetical protein
VVWWLLASGYWQLARQCCSEVGGAEWSRGFWLLAPSFWLLGGQCGSEVGGAEWSGGFWLLAAGCWLLATGWWLLAGGGSGWTGMDGVVGGRRVWGWWV